MKYSEDVTDALAEKGHVMGRSGIIGNGNVIVVDQMTGDLSTGADPRGNNLGLTGRVEGGPDAEERTAAPPAVPSQTDR